MKCGNLASCQNGSFGGGSGTCKKEERKEGFATQSERESSANRNYKLVLVATIALAFTLLDVSHSTSVYSNLTRCWRRLQRRRWRRRQRQRRFFPLDFVNGVPSARAEGRSRLQCALSRMTPLLCRIPCWLLLPLRKHTCHSNAESERENENEEIHCKYYYDHHHYCPTQYIAQCPVVCPAAGHHFCCRCVLHCHQHSSPLSASCCYI